MRIQEPLQGGIADVQLLGRLTPRDISFEKALHNSSKTLGEASSVDYSGPTDFLALPAGSLHAGLDPFPDQLQLELSKRGQQV